MSIKQEGLNRNRFMLAETEKLLPKDQTVGRPGRMLRHRYDFNQMMTVVWLINYGPREDL